MAPDKPSRAEEEYFAKREAELLKKRRESQTKAAANAERRRHLMKCPKCGADLTTQKYEGVQVDRCPECEGVWFDAGEAARLLRKDSGVVGIFRSILQGVRSSS
jgi:hypothetical protein